jgi:predicted MFS family arabinose efflux permease
LTVHVVPLLVAPFVLRGVILTASTLLFALAGGVLPASQRGAGFGLMETSYQVGAMAGASAGGLLYAGAPARPFQVSLALLALTALLSSLIRPVFASRDSTAATASPATSQQSRPLRTR